MNRLIYSIILISSFLTNSVFAGDPPKPLFVESANQELAPPPTDQAQIIFLEPINSIQGLFPVGIFEMNGENRTLLAITGAHSKAVLLFTPGQHTLMANHSGMIAHFLDINVEAGKRYYVLLRFIYAHGFQLRPIRPNGPSDYSVQNKKFPNWVSSTKYVEKTADGEAFFSTNAEAVTKSQTKGWEDWLAKTQEQRNELTLNANDDISN